jgi:hypothetical protein
LKCFGRAYLLQLPFLIMNAPRAGRAGSLWQGGCFVCSSYTPGGSGLSPAISARASGAAPDPRRPGHRAFFLGTRTEEAPHARAACGRWCSSQLRPQNHHPDHPAPHTAFHRHWARLVRDIAYVTWAIDRPMAFARAGCQFSPLLRPHSIVFPRRGNFRGSDLAASCFMCFMYHPHWTHPTGFGRWVGPLAGPIYAKHWEGLGTCRSPRCIQHAMPLCSSKRSDKRSVLMLMDYCAVRHTPSSWQSSSRGPCIRPATSTSRCTPAASSQCSPLPPAP